MEEGMEYQLRTRGSVLSFKTGAFRAEPGSALHSGIYNRELVASLIAGAIVVLVALIAVIKGVDIRGPHYIGAVVVFAMLTFLIRVYVLYEEYLELSIDREKGIINLIVRKMTKKRFRWALGELTGVRRGLTVIAPENPDGIEIVKKISMQHGMVIPGFGEAKEYHSVNLEFGELDTVAIFNTEEPEESEAVSQVINRFVGGSSAKTD